jgi:hypothetical protein
MTFDLLTDTPEVNGELEPLAPGAKLLRGSATPATAVLLSAIKQVIDRAPFRIMQRSDRMLRPASELRNPMEQERPRK